ncbi:hypothetical protein [Mycobacterium sp. 1081908.1]|uniref:hypothetical protein n=1 Tax=Mycobacterium sp. 1081908.1 TaxID=1834066 RepID=UPI0008013C1C|nr:hypothetical protein [Mycobacterium sp. 1081908.1]OBK46809.1 hypothetical protein A5655_08940 [Mycobacterium sp. 1081908.1]
MGPDAANVERFLVEWYGPQAPACSIGETAGRLNDGAASISARGTRVRLLMALAVPADGYAFGVFAAESAETVAQLCVDAGAPAERISAVIGWSATGE